MPTFMNDYLKIIISVITIVFLCNLSIVIRKITILIILLLKRASTNFCMQGTKRKHGFVDSDQQSTMRYDGYDIKVYQNDPN